MLLAIAVEDNSVENINVAEHFGRCTGFILYEIDENNKIVKEGFAENPINGTSGGTCQLPHVVNQIGANVIIAGGMGPKAIQLFNSYNIEVITAPAIPVKDVLSLFLNGQVKGYQPCENHSHEC